MKYLLILLIPFYLFSQEPEHADTLFQKSGKVYPCTILQIEEDYIIIKHGIQKEIKVYLIGIDKLVKKGIGEVYTNKFGFNNKAKQQIYSDEDSHINNIKPNSIIVSNSLPKQVFNNTQKPLTLKENGLNVIFENSYLTQIGNLGELNGFNEDFYALWKLGFTHSLTNHSAFGMDFGFGFKYGLVTNYLVSVKYKKWLSESIYLNLGLGKIINEDIKTFSKHDFSGERRRSVDYILGKSGYVLDVGLNFKNMIELNLLFENKPVEKRVYTDWNYREHEVKYSKFNNLRIYGGIKFTSLPGVATGACGAAIIAAILLSRFSFKGPDFSGMNISMGW